MLTGQPVFFHLWYCDSCDSCLPTLSVSRSYAELGPHWLLDLPHMNLQCMPASCVHLEYLPSLCFGSHRMSPQTLNRNCSQEVPCHLLLSGNRWKRQRPAVCNCACWEFDRPCWRSTHLKSLTSHLHSQACLGSGHHSRLGKCHSPWSTHPVDRQGQECDQVSYCHIHLRSLTTRSRNELVDISLTHGPRISRWKTAPRLVCSKEGAQGALRRSALST